MEVVSKDFFYIIMFVFIFSRVVNMNSDEEYCFGDVFQPRCSVDEIIIIEEAHFGRKIMGRCLSDEGAPSDAFLADPKFLGCYTDIKYLLDPECSGKRQCDVPIAKINALTHCHKWTKLYLQVRHDCLKVINENRQCKALTSLEKQYLIKSDMECGNADRPWTIESMAGQKITLKLIQNLGSEKSNIYFDKSQNMNQPCERLATVIDSSTKIKIPVCSGVTSDNNGKEFTFESSSNVLQIIFQSGGKSSQIIISVESTGCSDLIPPTDAWLKRTENEATIGCYSTRLRWKLKCLGQRWIGVIGNCSHENQVPDSLASPTPFSISKENSVVAIITISVVGIVICSLIICLGIVFLKRYYILSESKRMKHLYAHNKNSFGYHGHFVDMKKTSDDVLDKKLKFGSSYAIVTNDSEQNQKYYDLNRSLMK